MVVKFDSDSDDEKFYKTLHRDIELIHEEDGWDINMKKDDYVILTGLKNLKNECILAIITRYKELKNNPTYSDFGCKAYELIKSNKSTLIKYKLESYFKETLMNIRRVKNVDYVIVTEEEDYPYEYFVKFQVTSHNDETVYGNTTITKFRDKKLLKTELLLTTTQDYVNSFEPVTMYLTLTYGDKHPLSGQILELYAGNYLINRVVTNEEGKAEYTYYPNTTNFELALYAKFTGNGKYNECTCESVIVSSTSFYFTQVNGELILVYTDGTTPPDCSLEYTEDGKIYLNIYTDDALTFSMTEDGELIATDIGGD